MTKNKMVRIAALLMAAVLLICVSFASLAETMLPAPEVRMWITIEDGASITVGNPVVLTAHAEPELISEIIWEIRNEQWEADIWKVIGKGETLTLDVTEVNAGCLIRLVAEDGAVSEIFHLDITEPPAEIGDAGSEEPARDPAEESAKGPTEEPAEEPTEEPTEEPAEVPTEEPIEEPAEELTEQLAEELTEELAEELNEEPKEEPAKEPTEEPAEVSAGESTEEPTQEPTEELTEESADVPSEETAEKPMEEPAKEPTGEPAEEPAEEPTEESADEPSEETAEKPMEEPAEEPTGEPTEEPAEEPTEEPTGEPAEEPAADAPAAVRAWMTAEADEELRIGSSVELTAHADPELTGVNIWETRTATDEEGKWQKIGYGNQVTIGITEENADTLVRFVMQDGTVSEEYRLTAAADETPEANDAAEPVVEEPAETEPAETENTVAENPAADTAAAEETGDAEEAGDETEEGFADGSVIAAEGAWIYSSMDEVLEPIGSAVNGAALRMQLVDETWARVELTAEDGSVLTGYARLSDLMMYLDEAPEEEIPVRSVLIRSTLDDAAYVTVGTEVVMTAELIGFTETDEYTVQWQYTPDGGTTVFDAAGGNETSFTYKVNKENFSYTWRIIVTLLPAETPAAE